jgi:beta-lactamase regulating signal transducer with metallopeptidase domain
MISSPHVAGPFLQASSKLLALAAEPAVRSILVACAAALVLSALRVKSVAPRLAVWKIVLCCALAMPVLGWVVPALPFSIPAPQFAGKPVFGAVEVASSPAAGMPLATTEPSLRTSAAVASGTDLKLAPAAAEPFRPSPAHTSKPRRAESLYTRLKVIAGAVYVAVATIFLARFLLGFLLTRRLERAARTVNDARVLDRLRAHSRAARLKKLPRLAESEIVLVPVTLGVRRSSILLPAAWRDWDDTELDAVMAHEVSHVKRGDALTQRLSLLHRAAFWFSPLSWWLDRQIAELAEDASDEAALAHGADRTRYAETLLNFFSELDSSSGRMRWQGVSMATPGTAERRVDRILAWKGATSSGLGKSLALGLALLAPPVVFLAAAVHPTIQTQAATLSPTQQEAAPPSPARVPYVARVPEPLPRVIPIPPMPVVAPVPPAPFAPFVTQESGQTHVRVSGSNYVDDEDDWRNGQIFVIASGKKHISVGRHNVSFNSSGDDDTHWLGSKLSGDFIWFERDGKDFVTRDEATIKRAMDLFAPMQALDEKQEELGKQQEALGEQQEALGQKMEEVKVTVPDMTVELDRLREKLKQLGAGGTQEELGELQSEIGELQSRIGELQSQAGRRQSEIGRQQGELGRKQGELGRKQGEIGRQQAELSKKATAEMKSVIDDAIAHGLAKPE